MVREVKMVLKICLLARGTLEITVSRWPVYYNLYISVLLAYYGLCDDQQDTYILAIYWHAASSHINQKYMNSLIQIIFGFCLSVPSHPVSRIAVARPGTDRRGGGNILQEFCTLQLTQIWSFLARLLIFN